MTETSNHNNILGITENDTVMLDFDDMSFRSVRYWAKRTCQWFKLKGYIILKSSKNCYHVVFDRRVSWRQNARIMAWVCLLSNHKSLTKWFLMQCIKQGSTLRVSTKKNKPQPRIVFRSGNQKDRISEYLKFRKLVKNIISKLGDHA